MNIQKITINSHDLKSKIAAAKLITTYLNNFIQTAKSEGLNYPGIFHIEQVVNDIEAAQRNQHMPGAFLNKADAAHPYNTAAVEIVSNCREALAEITEQAGYTFGSLSEIEQLSFWPLPADN